MKKFLVGFIAIVATISSTLNLKADDHSETEPYNMQVNFCKLNEGISMEEYSDAVNDYIQWSKKNDVEVYVSRQMPIFPHDNFVSNRGFDFQNSGNVHFL